MEEEKRLSFFPAVIFDDELRVFRLPKKQEGAQLAVKLGKTFSMLYSNPTLLQIEVLLKALEVHYLHFFYLQLAQNKMLFVERKDKAQYNVFILNETEIERGVVVTSHNSVSIITQRFVEDSLFDDRPNEKRYLREEHWFNYLSGQEQEYTFRTDPLYGLTFTDIGQYEGRIAWVHLLDLKKWVIQPENLLQEIQLFQQEFQELQEFPLTPTLQDLLDKVSTVAKVKGFQCLENGIAVALVETHELRDQLRNLPFPHRFLREAIWYYSNPQASNWSQYFVSISRTIYDFSVQITLHNPSKEHIEALITTLLTHPPSAQYEEDYLAVSRPILQGDKRNHSILLSFEQKNNSWYFFHKPIEKLQAKEVIQYVLDFIR